MSRLKVSYDWLDFELQADEAALQATFAQICVSVGPAKVTRLLDKRARTTRDSTTIPLYPLAEWIAANWWCLFEEAEVPSRGISSDEYHSRHGLREGREGYAFPDLQFVPEGALTLIRWTPSSAIYQSVEFLESGQDRTETQELRQELADLIDAVIDRLEAHGIGDTWLQKEWRSIRNAAPDEREFCVAAAWLGLDPYELSDTRADEIIGLAARLPKHLQEEVLKAAPPKQLSAAVDWVDDGLRAIQANSDVDEKWIALRERTPASVPLGLPWQSGYDLAKQLRMILQVGDLFPINLDQLVGSPFPIVRASRPAASIDGLIGFSNSNLCCYTAKSRTDSRQFLCARGLVSFLFDKWERVDFYSSAQTNHQQRSRAFAAEFLAPASLIKKRLSGDEIGNEEVEDLASQFQVSAFVIHHQICNHRLGQIIG